MSIKLSISNIAWDKDHDEYMYSNMSNLGYSGLELAPTRLFAQPVYEKKREAIDFAECIKMKYKLHVSSIQSIWYGVTKQLFGNDDERRYLFDYTKKAIDFASYMSCRNVVFGSPKNRNRPEIYALNSVYDFFSDLGNYAISRGVILALEANPTIYGTNFINTTTEAFNIVKTVSNPGFGVNLDLGTMLINEEDIQCLNKNFSYINHIHISEPNLELIKNRALHKKIFNLAAESGFNGYISIEMKKSALVDVLSAMQYICTCVNETE